MKAKYAFPGCVVYVDLEREVPYIETRFPDGARLGATANDDEQARFMAADLGYHPGDLCVMTVDHELAHSWLAYQRGLRFSPTIWRNAHPQEVSMFSDAEVAGEEEMVLRFQRVLAARDGDGPWEAMRVPWDEPW